MNNADPGGMPNTVRRMRLKCLKRTNAGSDTSMASTMGALKSGTASASTDLVKVSMVKQPSISSRGMWPTTRDVKSVAYTAVASPNSTVAPNSPAHQRDVLLSFVSAYSSAKHLARNSPPMGCPKLPPSTLAAEALAHSRTHRCAPSLSFPDATLHDSNLRAIYTTSYPSSLQSVWPRIEQNETAKKLGGKLQCRDSKVKRLSSAAVYID